MEHEYEYDEDFEREIPLEDQPLDDRGGFDDPERGSWDDAGEYDEYDDEFDDLEPGSG
jgi:hypothetical protein